MALGKIISGRRFIRTCFIYLTSLTNSVSFVSMFSDTLYAPGGYEIYLKTLTHTLAKIIAKV